MKYKKIMLVSLFLLAILTLGAVSAAEDADGLAAEDMVEEQIDSPAEDVDLIADWEDFDDTDDSDDPEFDPINQPEGNLPYKPIKI